MIGVVFMFMPMMSAVLVQRFVCREQLKGPLGIYLKLNRWWLVAWLLPLLITLATIGISLLIPGISFSPDLSGYFERLKEEGVPLEQIEQIRAQITSFPTHIIWIIWIIQGLLAGITINAITGFGEELGWRGFLLRNLIDIGVLEILCYHRAHLGYMARSTHPPRATQVSSASGGRCNHDDNLLPPPLSPVQLH
jgi:hypothetical protein